MRTCEKCGRTTSLDVCICENTSSGYIPPVVEMPRSEVDEFFDTIKCQECGGSGTGCLRCIDGYNGEEGSLLDKLNEFKHDR